MPEPVTPSLRPFVGQWAVRLTTYRRDGTPVATPVNIAVIGNKLVFRSYAHAWKCRRLEREPRVEVAPSGVRGTPSGATIHGRARLLHDVEDAQAARAIDAKYPLFQRLLVRTGHRLLRYRTVHFEIAPVDSADA